MGRVFNCMYLSGDMTMITVPSLTHLADEGVLHGTRVVPPHVALGPPQEGARRLCVLVYWVFRGPSTERPTCGGKGEGQIGKSEICVVVILIVCFISTDHTIIAYQVPITRRRTLQDITY